MMPYNAAQALRYQLQDLPLPDGIERTEFIALLTAGVRDCLLQELDAIAERRQSVKDAARGISEAVNWSRLATEIRQRDEWYQANQWARRVKA